MSLVQAERQTVSAGSGMSRTRPSFMVGGRYRLLDKLGSGGFGQVWKARDLALDVDVAVKETRLPAVSVEERARRLARAEREARNAARLRDHPNIVAVHDVVVDGGTPWIVMRLVAGRSLEEQVRTSGPLSADAAVNVAAGLLNALGAAHRAGVIHRDVKPANVMLADGGEVLLTDFGTAVHQADTALTPSGSFIGSPEYIAPERIDGADAQAASDLFSLGVTLYRAVEGFSPFHRDNPGGTLRAILQNQPPPPRRAGRLASLIMALMEKEPARRPTVPEALALLEPPPAPTPKAPRSPKPRRRRAVTVTVASGAALALTTVGAAVIAPSVATEHSPACIDSDGGRGGALPSPVGMLPNTPHPPSLTAPADQAVVPVGQPVMFGWTGSAGVAKIRFGLSRNGDVPAGGWQVSDWRRPNGCSFTPTVPGLYLWEVMTSRLAGKANGSGWSEQRYLVVEPTTHVPRGTPRPPSLTSPADQAGITVGQSVTLSWTTSARQSSVRIYSPGGGWRVSPWQSSRSYTFTPSAPGLYYWTVSAENGTGAASGNSEERYLVVR